MKFLFCFMCDVPILDDVYAKGLEKVFFNTLFQSDVPFVFAGFSHDSLIRGFYIKKSYDKECFCKEMPSNWFLVRMRQLIKMLEFIIAIELDIRDIFQKCHCLSNSK